MRSRTRASRRIESFMVKPGTAISVVVFLAGLLLTGVGIGLIIPTFGAFGYVWTAVTIGITIYYGYNLATKRGAAMYEIQSQSVSLNDTPPKDLQARLRELSIAYEDGLITRQEYESQRRRIVESS